MHAAAAELQFEAAARLRDEIKELKRELRGMEAAGRLIRAARPLLARAPICGIPNECVHCPALHHGRCHDR